MKRSLILAVLGLSLILVVSLIWLPRHHPSPPVEPVGGRVFKTRGRFHPDDRTRQVAAPSSHPPKETDTR